MTARVIKLPVRPAPTTIIDAYLCGEALLIAVPGHVLLEPPNGVPWRVTVDEARAAGHALLTLADTAAAMERDADAERGRRD